MEHPFIDATSLLKVSIHDKSTVFLRMEVRCEVGILDANRGILGFIRVSRVNRASRGILHKLP